MKKTLCISYLLMLALAILFMGCGDDDEPPTSPSQTWQTVFEDNFDGNDLDTTDWTQLESTPPAYSLTGSGELEIEGESGAGDGATFVYNTAITGNSVRVTSKFRTTLNDSILDDVDLAIILNYDLAGDNGYALALTSDPSGMSRDYELLIARITNSAITVLMSESMGGVMPQISGGNDYILEGVNVGGTITFTVKDGGGNVMKSITVNDATYSGGKIGFNGDLNIETVFSQSIFFDFVKVETLQ